MNRKFQNGVAGAVLSVLAFGSAQAGDFSQLAASAGISATDAAVMTLDEIAARKFSGEGNGENVQTARGAGGFGKASAVRSSRTSRDVGLDEFHVGLINGGVSGNDERQIVPVREAIAPNMAARQQLAGGAGLGATEAASLSLDAIAAHKFDRETDGDD